MENGNGECVKETTTRQKSRKQPTATNEFSTQQENPTARGGIWLAPKQKCVLFQ